MLHRKVFVVAVFCVFAASATTTESPDSVLKTANKYYNNFRLGQNKSVVLVLGNRDAGKSVLTKFLTTDSTKIQVKDRMLEFNGQRTIARTIVPELMIEAETDTSFYDCPVINDPDEIVDITAARSVHELLDFANEFKILFVIQSLSISNVNNSKDFFQLAENAVNLIKDIRKYSDGIALVVRKVEEQVDEEIVYDEDTDRELINKCIEFLIKTETQLIRQSFTSVDAQRQNIEKINFINALLKNERIKIFRTPMKAEALKLEKEIILSMINKDLRFVEKENEDFSCQINNDTQQTVPILINELKKQLTAALPQSIGSIHKVYVEEQKRNWITLNTTKEIISNSSRINPMEIRLPPSFHAKQIISHDLEGKIRFFAFLQRFSSNEENRVLNISTEVTSQLRSQVHDILLNEMKDIFNEIKRYFVQNGKQFYLDIEIITKIVNDAQQKLSEIRTEKCIPFANQLNKVINELEIDGLNGHIQRISRDLEFMQVLGDENEPMPKTIVNEFHSQCKQYADSLKVWYNFVVDLRNQLSTYAVQRNKTTKQAPFLGVYDINIIGSDEDTVEPHIIDVKLALDYLPAITNREAIENVRVNRYMLKALQVIWSTAMSNNSFVCASNRLIVKGNFLKISEIIPNASCWPQIKFIEIFALNKVFIDADINKSGRNVSLSIISPTWEIIPSATETKSNRHILLTGKNATFVMGPARNGSIIVNRDGDTGLNGIPGGVGGNFLAIGRKFVDEEYLIVDLGGGNGGPGQKGGNGKYVFNVNVLNSYYKRIQLPIIFVLFRC